MVWAGWILGVVPVLMLLLSAVMKFLKPPALAEGFTHLGYAEDLALGLGILELFCTVLYVIPRTSVLGAILLTGYLGGATATHVRVGEPSAAPVLLGIVLWVGLYLRDERLRTLLAPRRDPSAEPAPRRGIVSVLGTVLCGLVGLVVVLVIVITLQPADYRVVRSATISAPPQAVFAQVNDFHKWEAWSPWAKLDPAAKNTFEGAPAGTGAVFKWSGNDKIGEGHMAILESRPGELVRIQLDFIRPFEAGCTTEFQFKPEGDQTAVTWTMSGKNNLIGKAFCLVMNMDKTVGGDFERGLAQMKAAAEAAAKK
jgi:uncharacterized protein YndB with AHSA1/START domain